MYLRFLSTGYNPVNVCSFIIGWTLPLLYMRRNHRLTMEALHNAKLQQKFMYWELKQIGSKLAPPVHPHPTLNVPL